MARLSQFTRIQRITIILFVLVLTNWGLESSLDYSLIGADLINLFFIVFLSLLILSLIPHLIRAMVWRLRNRLLLTYFLIGVVPIVLIGTMLILGLVVLMGQTTGYLLQTEIHRRLDVLEVFAHDLAVATSYRMRVERPEEAAADFLNDLRLRAPKLRAVVRAGGREFAIPDGPPLMSFRPGIKGVIPMPDGTYLLAASAEAQVGPRRVQAITFEVVDADLLANLLPGLATVQILGIRSSGVSPLPAPGGFWDAQLAWLSPIVLQTPEGGTDRTIAAVVTRPSLVVRKLFSTLGELAGAIGIALMVIASIFVAVEIASLIWSIRLTRAITRTVHDLYEGTRKVELGQFSHRIPIRTNDQLSELAKSFNSMTQHMELLISEVKEKEKLESELEIAREVQAQLFPKAIPKLKTLELAGVCKPGRVVSGDYYDFISLDSHRTALAIGDVAGKGISAALLMASIQSAFHAQLNYPMANGNFSTGVLVSRLNRQLYESTSAEKYATFYCAVYDEQNGLLAYTNAGHLPPILIRSGKASRLEVNGMVVGILPDAAYTQVVIELQRGDLLAGFTDGITECEDSKGEQFGEERLIALLIEHREKPLDQVVHIVTTAVRDWAHDLDNQDDTTMLLARRV